MIGDITFDKSNQIISLILYSIIIVDKYGVNGVIRRNNTPDSFVDHMGAFINQVPYKNNKEVRTIFNKSLYTQYYGFLDRCLDSDGKECLRLTPRGRKLLDFIGYDNNKNFTEQYFIKDEFKSSFRKMLWYSILFDSFGKMNPGAQSSKTDVDAPKVIIKTLLKLGQATNEEIFYILFSLNGGDKGNDRINKTFDDLINEVIVNRNNSIFSYDNDFQKWNVTNKVSDPKVINLLADSNIRIIKKVEDQGVQYNCLEDEFKQLVVTSSNMLGISSKPNDLHVYSEDPKNARVWVDENILGKYGNTQDILFEYPNSNDEPLTADSNYTTWGILDKALLKASKNPFKNFYLIVNANNEKEFWDNLGDYQGLIERIKDYKNNDYGRSKYLIKKRTPESLIEKNIALPSNLNLITILPMNTIQQQSDFDGNFSRIHVEKSNPISVPQATTDASPNIKKFLAAIRTKPFILIAGISGTGKSRIVRKLAQATLTLDLAKKYDVRFKEGYNEDNFINDKWLIHNPANFELIQVKPNWHNSMEVVGYKSNIGTRHYELTPFVKFVVKAWLNPSVPFFLCLDEMNLAPVEQYFAEFLSAIESRSYVNGIYNTDPIIKPFDEFGLDVSADLINSLNSALGEDIDNKTENYFRSYGLTLPKNLIVMGTVNMDETTFTFSRKVLDRAMSIEMNEVNLENFFNGSTENDVPEISDDNELLINRPVRGLDDQCGLEDTEKEDIKNYLESVNSILDETPFKLGYRAANEALLYVGASKAFNVSDIKAALDSFTLMKILSRIEGDKKSLITKNGGSLLEALKTVITEEYPASNKKLCIMLETLNHKQFVSYWT